MREEGDHVIKQKRRWAKGEMARTIVLYCIRALTLTLIWAAVLKTAGVILDRAVELSDVLTFATAAFGGELLLLAFKRIFAKKEEDT